LLFGDTGTENLRATTALQRIGPISELPNLLAERGISLGDVLTGTGLAREDLAAERRVPFPVALLLLRRAAEVAGDPLLGLALGARWDHRALGAVGAMMASAPTLGEALRDYVGVQIGYSQGATVYLQRVGTDFALGYGIYDRSSPGAQQAYDLVVAVGCNLVRALTGGRVRVARVLISRRQPEDLARYQSVLKTPVLFDQEQTAMVLAAEAMGAALATADPAEHSRLKDQVHRMVQGDLDDLPAQVRHVLRPQLLLGEGGRDAVARELGVSGRTLTRRLAAAGTAFEDIKDEVRFAVARELLALTDLPVGQISAALSYSSHSSFVHAFQRWAGLAPSEWRAQHEG